MTALDEPSADVELVCVGVIFAAGSLLLSYWM